jgi:hypothetical protein
MRAHIGRRRHDGGITMEEMEDITQLGDQEENPTASESV